MAPADKLPVDQINHIIDQHLSEPNFSVDWLCVALAMSRSQLFRLVKEQTGLSTSLYIRQRRLQKARQLLIDTDMRVAEISDAVGMSTVQNFSNYFTNAFGMRPSEFRKQARHNPGDSLTLAGPDLRAIAESASEQATEFISETDADSSPAPVLRPRFRWLWAAGLLLALGLIATVAVQLWPAASAAQPTPSLAVLPFVSLGTPQAEPVADIIMDDVYQSVARLPNLRVIARSSSDQYKDTPKTTWQIGDDLQVAYLLKGSVLQNADQIQVRIELIDSNEDVRLWQRTYRAAQKDLFTLSARLASEVARQLNLTRNTPVSKSASVADKSVIRTRNLEAYNLFLEGRQLAMTRAKDPLLVSLNRFDRALALDSSFAEALAFKAEAYMLLQVLGYERADKARPQAERYALAAIRLDPANSTAYGVLGTIYHDLYQWQASENAFQIALQHHPNDAQAHYWYSLLLRTLGRLDEAIAHSRQAVALDPLYPVVLTGHVINCVYAGRFDLAQASLDNGRDLFQDSFIFYLAEGYYFLCRQQYALAIANLKKMQVLNPSYGNNLSALVYCEARQGHRTQARTYLDTLSLETPRADYDRAVVWAGLAQTDSCLFYLHRAATNHYLHRDLLVNPIFRPYHRYPVFQAILQQFNLTEPVKPASRK